MITNIFAVLMLRLQPVGRMRRRYCAHHFRQIRSE
jgi:hypothetical protein